MKPKDFEVTYEVRKNKRCGDGSINGFWRFGILSIRK